MTDGPKRAQPALWVRVVHRLERAVGAPLETVLHSDPYFDLVTEATRMRARTGRLLEGVSRRGLHMLNLPAGSDIRNVREQLTRVERRLALVTKELAELEPSGHHEFRSIAQ